MKKSFFEDLPARKKPAHVPADGTADGVDSNQAGLDEKKVRQAVYDIRYRAKREDVELEQAMSQYFGNTTMTGPEKDAVKAKLFGEGYGLVSQQIWSDTMELEERAKGTGRDRKYRVRVKDKVSGRTYGRWANREKISQLRANPSIGAQGVEMSDAGKAYEGDDDDAGKTKEAPKAKKDDKKPTKENPKMKKEEVDVAEADSLAAMAARREKRLAAQRKREGTTASGRDFGHDYSLTPAQQKARRDAEFKAGMKKEALDPVGKEDGDVNNDGKKDSTDSYLMNRRKAIGKAMGKKHTKKEESQFSDWRQAFFESMGSEVDDDTVKKVTEKRVKNKVTINPEFNNSKY